MAKLDSAYVSSMPTVSLWATGGQSVAFHRQVNRLLLSAHCIAAFGGKQDHLLISECGVPAT